MKKWAAVALLVIAGLWGSSFVVTRVSVATFDPYDFLAWRFGLGAVVLVLLRPRSLAASKSTWLSGIFLGIIEALGTLFMTVGLVTTAASVAGFINGLYVVGTPLLTAVLFKRNLGRWTWLAVGISTIGLATLTVSFDSGIPHIGTGELLSLLGALCYSIHITFLSRLSTPQNALPLTSIQSVTMAVTYLVFAAPGGISIPQTGDMWFAVLYLGVFVGAFTLGGQTWAQAHLSAPIAALIMVSEPAWAATLAVLFLHESFTWRLTIGGGAILLAMVLSAVGYRRRRRPITMPH